MNVGWIGLGKLGLCCALVLDEAGHDVAGYDVSLTPSRILAGEAAPPPEDGIGGLLARHAITLPGSPLAVTEASDIVFVAVQTPHSPAYGGEIPAPARRRDFEYAYLTQAVRDVCAAARELRKQITLVVVSTVLPGTCGRYLRRYLGDWVRMVYSPSFIAMGTAIPDFRAPEFALAGCDRDADAEPLREVLAKVHDRPVLTMGIESAELAKVAYNVFISAKIAFANTIMEICHKTGADCDDVTRALSQATERVISPKYLRGGMGDGGGCHPRDLIAMSWLAERLDLSYDLLGEMARARDAQTEWLAMLAASHAEEAGLPLVILGKTYREGTPLTAGSPALLLRHYLAEAGREPAHWDPLTDDPRDVPSVPAVYVVATRHPEFPSFAWPAGSVVIDPWGYVPDALGVTVVRVGRKT